MNGLTSPTSKTVRTSVLKSPCGKSQPKRSSQKPPSTAPTKKESHRPHKANMSVIKDDESVEIEHLRARVMILEAKVAITEDLELQVASLREQVISGDQAFYLM